MTEGTTTTASAPTTNARGAGFMLGSVVTFTVMDAVIKHLGGGYEVTQILLFRCLAALLPVAFFIYQAGGLKILRPQRPYVHLLRSAVGLCAMYCVFTAFTIMPLAGAIAIIFSAPLFMTVLSVPLLREKVGPRRWFAVIAGFMGVLIIVNPGNTAIQEGAEFALAGSFFMACAMIVVRKLGRTEHSACITFYFTCTGICTGLVGVAIEGWVQPGWVDLGLLCLVGLLGGVAQFLMTQAFRLSEVAVVAPLQYTHLIWGAVIGYIFWQEVPDLRLWLGSATIILSGLYMLHREAQWKDTRKLRLPKLRGRV